MSTVDNFIYAENLCTGSQGDLLSSCIVENLRFLPYLDDKAEALVKDSGFVKSKQLPYLSGNTYVNLTPIGVANATVRMQQENSYGVVSFRCLQTFGRPMLALPNLEDLGIPNKELNITETLVVSDDATEFDGVPLRDVEACGADDWCKIRAYLYNSRNLTLAFSTELSSLTSALEAIRKLIDLTGDFYALPVLAEEVNVRLSTAEASKNAAIDSLSAAITFVETLPITWDTVYALNTFNSSKALLQEIYYFNTNSGDIVTNVVTPLTTSIDDNTDFSTYDFNITTGVSVYVVNLDFTNDDSQIFMCQQFVADWGVPSSYDVIDTDDKQLLIRNVISNYTYEIFNIATTIINKIQALYTLSNVSLIVDEINVLVARLDLLIVYKAHFYSEILNEFVDLDKEGFPLSIAVEFNGVTIDLNTFITNFTTGTVLVDILVPDIDNEDAEAIVDNYLDVEGTNHKIVLAKLKNDLETALNLYQGEDSLIDNPNISPSSYSSSGEVLTLNLGYDFQDKSKYYFADIAYAVGFGRLTNIESIIIDNEIYLAEDLRDSVGNSVTGISESGCTKYSFTRHVLPTYDPIVEMYVYPGLPDQPYCPTVNRYNNMAVTKYSGMFTKLLAADLQNDENSMIGLYVYTGYAPLEARVENIYQVGTIDMNAINLNDPTLDENSYESMLQRQITNLTNSDSLVTGGAITANDLKYYFHAELVGTPAVTPDDYHSLDVPDAMTLPNMAIVEFINFPLGSSLTPPNITIKFTAADPYTKA